MWLLLHYSCKQCKITFSPSTSISHYLRECNYCCWQLSYLLNLNTKGQSFPPGHSYAWPFTSISMRNMAFIKNHWSVHFIWSRWQISHTDEVSALFDEWNIYGQSADRYEMMLCPRLNINHRNLLINVQWYNFVFSSILYI